MIGEAKAKRAYEQFEEEARLSAQQNRIGAAFAASDAADKQEVDRREVQAEHEQQGRIDARKRAAKQKLQEEREEQEAERRGRIAAQADLQRKAEQKAEAAKTANERRVAAANKRLHALEAEEEKAVQLGKE